MEKLNHGPRLIIVCGFMENPPIERDALVRWSEMFQAPIPDETALFDHPIVAFDPLAR